MSPFIVRVLNADGTPCYQRAEDWGLKFGVRNFTDTAFLSFHTTLLDAAQCVNAIRVYENRMTGTLWPFAWPEYRPGWRMGLGVTSAVLRVNPWTGVVRTTEEMIKELNDPPPYPEPPAVK